MISGALCDMIVPSTKELMIEVSKNYKITLDEEQARLLYHILDVTDNDRRQGLNGLYDELKDTLKIGIR